MGSWAVIAWRGELLMGDMGTVDRGKSLFRPWRYAVGALEIPFGLVLLVNGGDAIVYV